MRIANKSTSTIEKNLKKLPKFQRQCRKKSCMIADPKICFKTKCTYKMKCCICNKFYIGSTEQYFHERIDQNLSRSESTYNEHFSIQHPSFLPQIRSHTEATVLNDFQNIRDMLVSEAMAIKKYCSNLQLLNKREEMTDVLRYL